MGKKYIIELKDNTAWLQWVNVVDDGQVRFDFKYPEDLTPYTEPDLEQVRKEAFEKGYSTAVAEQECAVRGAAEKGYQKGYETGYKDGYHEPGKNQQEAYQRGLNDAWECTRKIRGMTWDEQREVFGTDYYTDIIALPVSECIEKIRQYEQEKDRQARIEYNFDEIKDVLETTAKECNVSLDEIAEVLRKMKENSDG